MFLLSRMIIPCFFSGWIYVVEMLLKIYAYGFENYWRDGQNRFDFIITVIIGNSLCCLILFALQTTCG